MTLFLCWFVLPLALGVACFGLGRLAEAASGRRVDAAILLPLGFAAMIVVGSVTTIADFSAELTTPAIGLLAVAGLLVRRPKSARGEDAGVFSPHDVLAAIAVYAVFAAPIVLSGEATFAGYIKLDDTATWMAFTDWIMEHGPNVHGLAPSSYEATLDINLGGGYPVGGFVPLGYVHEVLGEDVAWTIQPFMASLAAMLALSISSLLRRIVPAPGVRALVAFIAAQPAILYGYYLWGGIKEVESALLLATTAALAFTAVRSKWAPRAAIPLCVAAAGLIGALGIGASVWLVPLLLPAVIFTWRRLDGWPELGKRTAVVLGWTILFSVPVLARGIPALIDGSTFSPTNAALTSDTEIGNLLGPLDPLQIVGIWPAGDFRIDPSASFLSGSLIVLAIAGAILGLGFCLGHRRWELPGYVLGVLVGVLAIAAVGSPWVDGKALASASPAILALAGVTGAIFLARGSRLVGGGLLALLAAGVLWSNIAAYPEVTLAPRAELTELEDIGELIKGQGPTLMTDDQIYGARHFLRDADTEGVSQLRRNPIFLRDGKPADRSIPGGTDEIDLRQVQGYTTIVTRRSPAQSRPPSSYIPVYRGEYYDVWQQLEKPPEIISHLPLGDATDGSAIPNCDEVRGLAASARQSGGRLLAAQGSDVAVAQLDQTTHPAAWGVAGQRYLQPDNDSGTISTQLNVPRGGVHDLWLGGSVRGRMTAYIDGNLVGEVEGELLADIGYTLLGAVEIAPGLHDIRLEYGGESLRPGTAKSKVLDFPIGPLVFSSDLTALDPVAIAPDQAVARLCGQPWDWIEAVKP